MSMNLRESTLRQRSVIDGSRLQRLFSTTTADLSEPLSFNQRHEDESFSLKVNYLAPHQEPQRSSIIDSATLISNSKATTTTETHSEDYVAQGNLFRKQDKKSHTVVDEITDECFDSIDSDPPSFSVRGLVKRRRHKIVIDDEQQQQQFESNSFSYDPQFNMSSTIALNEHLVETRQIGTPQYDLNDKLLIECGKEASDCAINMNLIDRKECKQSSKTSKEQPSKRVKRKSGNNSNNRNRDVIESHKLDYELICSCDEGFVNNKERSVNEDTITNLQQDTTNNKNESPSTTYSPRTRILAQQHKLVSLGERNGRSICNKHMPWFGIDVGGSLIKVVFFDPKEATREETVTLKRIRRYLKSSKPYGTTGKRDTHLEMANCVINKRLGSLHFIRFATSQMPQFLEMAKNKRFAETINTVCATGGGAYKFEEDIKSNLGITLHKTDELDSIIYGIHYIDKYNSERECYYLEDPLDDAKCVKVPYDFSRPYPYLVVNIGSGVSILAVYSSTSYSRISGSSIGGGTFLGLCSLLTQCKTFDEAIQLAKAGSSSKIDKLVKDIYGGDYPKFNLSGDTVASSFGHMNMAEKRKEVKREDLARALLEMVTINIGSIARMCAANEDIDRVVFIGNFLRVNQLSMKLLSYAVNYWSKGAMKALFLEHEGYFGAVGCFVESTRHLG